MSAGERSRQRDQCLLMALIGNVGEVASDFQDHALAQGKRAHGFLSNAFVEIADRDAKYACDLEEPPGGYTVNAALVLVRLLISDADEFSKLLLGQPQHDPPFMDTDADMIVDRHR